MEEEPCHCVGDENGYGEVEINIVSLVDIAEIIECPQCRIPSEQGSDAVEEEDILDSLQWQWMKIRFLHYLLLTYYYKSYPFMSIYIELIHLIHLINTVYNLTLWSEKW